MARQSASSTQSPRLGTARARLGTAQREPSSSMAAPELLEARRGRPAGWSGRERATPPALQPGDRGPRWGYPTSVLRDQRGSPLLGSLIHPGPAGWVAGWGGRGLPALPRALSPCAGHSRLPWPLGARSFIHSSNLGWVSTRDRAPRWAPGCCKGVCSVHLPGLGQVGRAELAARPGALEVEASLPARWLSRRTGHHRVRAGTSRCRRYSVRMDKAGPCDQ